MGLQLSSTNNEKKKPLMRSELLTHEEKQFLSPPYFYNDEPLFSRTTRSVSSSSVSSASSSDSSAELDGVPGEQDEDFMCTPSTTNTTSTSTTYPIYASSSKNVVTSAATAAGSRHKLQQKLTKAAPENNTKFPSCILHIKVAMKTTTYKKKSSTNYFGPVAGPIPLITGHYSIHGHPKASSISSLEHLAKTNLYYQHQHQHHHAAYSSYCCPRPHSNHYTGRHVRHVHAGAVAQPPPLRGSGHRQSFGKRKPNSTVAVAAAAAAAVAAAAATQKTVVTTATAGNDTATSRSAFHRGGRGDDSHRLCSDSHFTSYSSCRSWFEASSSANPLYHLDSSYSAKYHHVKDVYCPLDTLDMLNKLAHWFLFPIANDIDMDTECAFNRYFGGDTDRDAGGEVVDIFQGLTSFFSSIVRKVFQVDFSQSIGTTFQDSCIGRQQQVQVSTHEAYRRTTEEGQGEEYDNEAMINRNSENNNTMEPSHALFHSISSIDSEEARFSSSGTSNNTQQQQRYLDIECILRLPTMIYDEEGSSSDGFVGSIDTYDTDGGKSIKIDHDDHVPLLRDEKQQRQSKDHNGAISLEWSWITVPRQEDPSQSIHSITSLEETTLNDGAPSSFHNNNSNKEDDQCIICLQKFQRGERLCILPCRHTVHTTCIDKWLCSTSCGSFSQKQGECSRNALCPMCKSPLRVLENDQLNNRGNDCLENSIKSMASEESFVVHHFDSDGDGNGNDEDSMKSMNLDGLVPSWAFERLGSKIAK